MSAIVAPANDRDERRPQTRREQADLRRARARRNALLLALLAAGLYVGFIVFGAVFGLFPG